MFWAAVLVLVGAGVALVATSIWWVPAVGGLALAWYCLGRST